LNLLYLRPGVSGGTETYAKGLLDGFGEVASDFDFVVFVSRAAATWPFPPGLRARRVVCSVSAESRAARHLFEQGAFPALLAETGIDLVHSLGYTGPWMSPCPSVVTIHDVNVSAFGAVMKPADRIARTVFPFLSSLRADLVATISDFSRFQIIQHFRVAPERVRTIYHGVPSLSSAASAGIDESPNERILGLPPRFLAAFSAESPHKRTAELVRVFRRLREEGRLQHDLILLGKSPRGLDLSSVPGVRSLGYVPRSVLAQVLDLTDWLIVPSVYEGFGLPVLEAMSRGTPVMCSRAAALPEVAGDAAVYFDPWSEEDMKAKIAEAAADMKLRDRLSMAGRIRAAGFTWARTAGETLNAYSEVLCARDSARRGRGR